MGGADGEQPSAAERLRMLEKKYEMTGKTGAYVYMAPEVLLQKPYNEKVDVFRCARRGWAGELAGRLGGRVGGRVARRGLGRTHALYPVQCRCRSGAAVANPPKRLPPTATHTLPPLLAAQFWRRCV